MQVYKSSVMIAYEKGSYFVLSCHWNSRRPEFTWIPLPSSPATP